ncbi:MAG: helix-turn-helix transcriptional regulator [Thermodesulfobacteriota bacterium]
MKQTLGERIKELRIAADMTLRELARQVEIAPSHMSDIEHNRRHPSEEKLKLLAKAISADFEELKNLDPRLGELKDWMRGQPAVAQLLRRIRQSDKPDKLIQDLLKATEE